MVRKCQICTEYSSSQSARPLQNHEILTRPWQIIGTDLFHLDGKDYLLVSYYYSKFPFVRRLPINMTSSTVVGILKELFSEQGIPERVMSDNGPQFVSEAFKTFAKLYEFQPTLPKIKWLHQMHRTDCQVSIA